jgi:hypothetical protein
MKAVCLLGWRPPLIGFRFDHTDIITPIGQSSRAGECRYCGKTMEAMLHVKLIGCKHVCRVSAINIFGNYRDGRGRLA